MTTNSILKQYIEGQWVPVVVGARGPTGPAGSGGRLTFFKKASGSLGGQRMVIGNLDGTSSYADTTNVTHAGKVLGMTLSAVSDAEDVEILREGLIIFSGWDFNPNLPVYLGVNGLLTQSASATGFSQIVGFAESPTNLFINLREPIIL